MHSHRSLFNEKVVCDINNRPPLRPVWVWVGFLFFVASLSKTIELHHRVHYSPPTEKDVHELFNVKSSLTIAQSSGKNIAANITTRRECKKIQSFTPIERLPMHPRNPIGDRRLRYKQCLRYQCQWKDTEKCDTSEATNYDGLEPPCCNHVLRDMVQAFDDVMCELGLEYYIAFGSLLGLIRGDRILPWTLDNDFILFHETWQYLIDMPEEAKQVFAKHGIALFDDIYTRICITPDFLRGKVATKWSAEDEVKKVYSDVFPYSDIFVAGIDEFNYTYDEQGCGQPKEHVLPLKRMRFYNGTLTAMVPNNPEKVLEDIFGEGWRTPDPRKKRHGNTACYRRDVNTRRQKPLQFGLTQYKETA